jgi:hypothetical protein
MRWDAGTFTNESLHIIVELIINILIYILSYISKTLSAIAIIMHYRDELPALVMLPSSLARQWKAELLKHASEVFSSEDICLISKATDVVRGKIALVPYTLFDKMADCGHIRYYYLIHLLDDSILCLY